MSRGSMKIGYTNPNGQTVVGKMDPGDRHQVIYVLKCEACGLEYGARGSDVFDLRCPRHDVEQVGMVH